MIDAVDVHIMDILKSFVLDGSEFAVNVMWDDGKPFFRATEIGAVLGLKNVHETINDFDYCCCSTDCCCSTVIRCIRVRIKACTVQSGGTSQ